MILHKSSAQQDTKPVPVAALGISGRLNVINFFGVKPRCPGYEHRVLDNLCRGTIND